MDAKKYGRLTDAQDRLARLQVTKAATVDSDRLDKINAMISKLETTISTLETELGI